MTIKTFTNLEVLQYVWGNPPHVSFTRYWARFWPCGPALCAHPQVQPDLDELEVNMEDNEDAESTKSEVKLGKLQFSLDYDFQKGEVRTFVEK